MSKPANTLAFLDALKAQQGLTSDYQLWKRLGWKQSTVSNYRQGRNRLSRDHAIRIADELGLSREYVVACVELERETSVQARAVWESIALRFRDAAASILLGLVAASALMHPSDTQGKTAMDSANSSVYPRIHYTCLGRWLRRLLALTATLALAGCTALQQPSERAFQVAHAIDVLQTRTFRDDPCIEEGHPLTRALIGREPSSGATLAWGVGVAVGHALVTQWLIENDHPHLANAWEWITITDKGIAIARNHELGARIYGGNTMGCVR